jgi:hypothetical protein
VIFLKTKVRYITLAIIVGTIVTLGVMAYRITQGGAYGGMLLAVPKTGNERGVSIDALEEINENKFMLTYEHAEEQTVKTERVGLTARMVSTNYTYAQTVNFPIVSGGFFTKAMQDAAQKSVVLNEKAAFDLFGGVDISGSLLTCDGDMYTIVGVVQDGDAVNRNIYIPATIKDAEPDTFIFKTDGVSEVYVLNVCKTLGITETDYKFFNLGFVATGVFEKLTIAGMSFVCCLLVFALIKRAGVWLRVFNRDQQTEYASFLNRSNIRVSDKVIPLLKLAVATAAVTAVVLYSLQYMVGIFLVWMDRLMFIQDFGTEILPAKLALLEQYALWSNFALAGYVIALLFFMVSLAERE